MARKKLVCIDTRKGPVVFGARKSRSFCRGQSFFTKVVSHEELNTLLLIARKNVRNVPQIYGYDRIGQGRRYKVHMQHVGKSLAETPRLVLDRRRLRTTLKQTIADLERIGIYHADLNPLRAAQRNMTVDENGKYWVIDFGKVERPRHYDAAQETRAILLRFFPQLGI
jgi:predicted Ser/Thr protein kinase